MYSNGAEHINSFGLGLCADGNGLFHAVTSYCKKLTIAIICCREKMPDPAFYALCLQESFDALKSAYAEERAAKQIA